MNAKSRLILFFCLWVMIGCLKQKNETPDTGGRYDPELTVNFSLIQLNALTPEEGAPVPIDSNWTVSCVVRADDESGNMYNQLVVEDSSAGISLLLNGNLLYTKFPVGRKLYLNLRGLYVGNYHGTPQLGGAPAPDNSGVLQVSRLPAKNFSAHITAANVPPELSPVGVALDDLKLPNKNLLNRLIRISGVELVNPDYDHIYAEPGAATNISIKNCTGAKIIMRNSNYARFQAFPTPSGNGSITAVYSVYNGAGQLTIRDTSDVQMDGIRCDGTVAASPVRLSIDSIRKMYRGKDTLLGNYTITAVVTSDAVNRNFGAGNIIIQQGSSGIMVYFGNSAADIPDLGDSIVLNLAGSTLTKYYGCLEIKNIKTSKAVLLGKGRSVQPITLNLAALNADFTRYESVLVRIDNAKIATAGNFAGMKTLTDASGSIVLYTSYNATFAYLPVPSITKTFQGIATPYTTTNELKIRNPLLDIY